ncbi:MAG TPA: hypothetical protein EYN69_07530 [Flavobacteriales bacterium]|jgi:hypothetical protein|nr:hypothetical protein [Flavobacteriales bacterium]
MFVTKDHFIFIVNSNEVNDELYAAEGFPAGNPIGFLAEGEASIFKKTKIDDGWELYSGNHISPNLHIRSKNSLIGGAGKLNKTVYINVIPREDAHLGEWNNINNATDSETAEIQNANTSFQLDSQCLVDVSRDVDTFEIIESSASTINENNISFNL